MRWRLIWVLALGCSSGTDEPARAAAPVRAVEPAEPSSPPTTSIARVDAFPAEVDWPVVAASDGHDAPLPEGVLPDDFAIVVRERTETAPRIELRPRAGMSGRWELVATDAEEVEDPSVDLGESLIWSIEVPVRRVAGIYAFVLGHEEPLTCGAPTGLRSHYGRRARRLACIESPAGTLLRARLGQLAVDFAPP